MLGSLVYVGGMPLEEALDLAGIDGARLGDELDRIGYAGPLPCPSLAPHAFVELHIEQGPVLEAEGITIGAVTGVQGISWQELTITGQSNHAGTTPMDHAPRRGLRRRRAGRRACAGWRWSMGGHQVGTVGRMRPPPRPGQRRPRVGHAAPSTCATPTKPRCRRPSGAWPRWAEELAAAEGVTVDRHGPRPVRSRSSSTRGWSTWSRAPRSASATRCGGCRRARATTPRCWPASARPGWCSCPAAAASATTRPSTPIRPTWPPASTSCSTSCSTWPTGTSTAAGGGPAVTRTLHVGAAQMGPVQRDDTRKDVVERLHRPAPPGRHGRLRARRLPRAGPHHLLPPLVRRRPPRRRGLVRAGHARAGHAAAVRRGGPPRRRLLPRLRRAHPRRAPLQHAGPRRARRARSSPATARSTSPATSTTSPTARSSTSSATTSSPARTGSACGGPSAAGRDDDLQRPALARDLPGDGAAGRRADPVRLQHADPLRARPEPGHPPGLPQRAGACRPAPTRTARGWSAWPRAASRRASTRWPSRASSPRAGRSSPRR